MRNLVTMAVVALTAAPAAGFLPLNSSSPGKPAVDYSIAIENTMGHAMDFSYSDVDTTAETPLGTVEGHEVREFVIPSPARTNIVITERGNAMPGYVARLEITLKPDSVVEVSF
jgi:hypothetical protein